ncbi:RNA polymerase sigma factor [Amycolatopsis sp. NPDC049688]|uniref:RNA polymerase sigma factor n=1 Tax=Amycolatopsis sp. NPDC049688 TaxID=3154733 RepID=UPI0034462F99
MDKGDGAQGAKADTGKLRDPAADLRDAAFSAFYRNSMARLVTFLRWQGARQADAADAAQEAMIKAHRHWATIQNPDAWVRRVASREWGRIAHDVETPVESRSVSSALLRPTDDIEELEKRNHILRLLARLPPRQRQVLAWTMDGYSPAEIAEELDITPEATRTALFKARRALSNQVGPANWGRP